MMMVYNNRDDWRQRKAEQAEKVVLRWLKRRYQATPHPYGKYGPDIGCRIEGDAPVYVEVEWRNQWEARINNRASLHIPIRRIERSMFDGGGYSDFPTIYVAVNTPMQFCQFIDLQHVEDTRYWPWKEGKAHMITSTEDQVVWDTIRKMKAGWAVELRKRSEAGERLKIDDIPSTKEGISLRKELYADYVYGGPYGIELADINVDRHGKEVEIVPGWSIPIGEFAFGGKGEDGDWSHPLNGRPPVIRMQDCKPPAAPIPDPIPDPTPRPVIKAGWNNAH